ncbi:hypothetical protein PVK06_036375 [Gossypium arboreum]|uniref:Uncharacterized protein n=1 Tax=Gossypium arboreum TaxID=29729 RepID=A0ABR0NJE3_GOSAR|nr:hypothetical protein PVK06_036375 [Gossypium arboreum]
MLISKFNAIQSNTLSQLHKEAVRGILFHWDLLGLISALGGPLFLLGAMQRLLNGCCAAVPVCGFGELGVPMMDYPSLLKGLDLRA